MCRHPNLKLNTGVFNPKNYAKIVCKFKFDYFAQVRVIFEQGHPSASVEIYFIFLPVNMYLQNLSAGNFKIYEKYKIMSAKGVSYRGDPLKHEIRQDNLNMFVFIYQSLFM